MCRKRTEVRDRLSAQTHFCRQTSHFPCPPPGARPPVPPHCSSGSDSWATSVSFLPEDLFFLMSSEGMPLHFPSTGLAYGLCDMCIVCVHVCGYVW